MILDVDRQSRFPELFTSQFSQLKAEMDARMAEMDARLIALRSEVLIALANHKADLYDRIGQAERRLLLWMIGLWLSTPLATAGIVLALKHLGWL